ncbi:MAG TPA: hypothetical protein VEI03_10655 [Stellaceae bacterium]|nr:hypothetical protein [Stellaceae bacterium]
MNLIVELEPPEKRRAGCNGPLERHLPEAAVMLAFATHLLNTTPGLTAVEIHPDGEHGKRFDIRRWLTEYGFLHDSAIGKTVSGGVYRRDGQTLIVSFKPGLGDVVAETASGTIIAECKGGIVNTTHAGQQSRLRKGLCEAVGQLIGRPSGGRQVAVVPNTRATMGLAKKMIARTRAAGIDIAVVDEHGNVTDI